MPTDMSPAGICLDVTAAEDATLSGSNTALVLEPPAAVDRKYIGQHETTDGVTCDESGGGVSTADAGRSKTETTKNLGHYTATNVSQQGFLQPSV